MDKPAPFLADLVPYLTPEQAKWEQPDWGAFPLLRRCLRPFWITLLACLPAACTVAKSAHSVAGETAAPTLTSSK